MSAFIRPIYSILCNPYQQCRGWSHWPNCSYSWLFWMIYAYENLGANPTRNWPLYYCYCYFPVDGKAKYMKSSTFIVLMSDLKMKYINKYIKHHHKCRLSASVWLRYEVRTSPKFETYYRRYLVYVRYCVAYVAYSSYQCGVCKIETYRIIYFACGFAFMFSPKDIFCFKEWRDRSKSHSISCDISIRTWSENIGIYLCFHARYFSKGETTKFLSSSQQKQLPIW